MDRRAANRKLAFERRTGYRTYAETKKRIFRSRISKIILLLAFVAGAYATVNTLEVTKETRTSLQTAIRGF